MASKEGCSSQWHDVMMAASIFSMQSINRRPSELLSLVNRCFGITGKCFLLIRSAFSSGGSFFLMRLFDGQSAKVTRVFLPVTLLLCVAKKNKRAQQTLSQSDKHVALIKASHLYISADVVDPESGGKEISLTLELN